MSNGILTAGLIESINQLSECNSTQREKLLALLTALSEAQNKQFTSALQILTVLKNAHAEHSVLQKSLEAIEGPVCQASLLLQNTLEYAQTVLTSKVPEPSNQSEQVTSAKMLQYKELHNMMVLIASDDHHFQTVLIHQLERLKIHCTLSSPDEALQILHNAKQESVNYQMIIVAAKEFDHHAAYLARTLKANPAFQRLMSILATTHELPNFEVDRALLSGFACVLNLAKPANFARSLAAAWQTWHVKENFTRAVSLTAKNRILLVEDDPIAQKITQRQLSELGYAVDTAVDGKTALQVLSQEIYDLVLIDVGLPDISGLEVTAELRKLEGKQRHTPVIALSIYDLAKDPDSDIKAYLDEYLVKPLTMERLTPILDRWVNKKALPLQQQHNLPL